MWGPMMGAGYGGWGGMMVINGAVWLLILVGVFVVILRLSRSGGGPSRSSGLDVLEDRYARGDIQRDEYLQKKQDILSRSSGPPQATV